MAAHVFESYPPALTAAQKAYLVDYVKDWSTYNGLVVKPAPKFIEDRLDTHHVLATNAPVTLFPSPFPAASFKQAQDIQQTYNELYAAIADDELWLENIMKEYVLSRLFWCLVLATGINANM